MSRAERIAGIARIAERSERDAAEALVASKQRLDQIEARLSELSRYRDEYGMQMRRDQREGLSINELKRHQLFMRRLEEGVEHARASLTRAREEWRSREAHWRDKRARLDALERVVARHRADEARARGRRDERAVDDRACYASTVRREP